MTEVRFLLARPFMRYHSDMPMATREAQREYQRKWMAERRAAWFRSRRCVDCGTDEDLELDHADPTQKTSHRVWSWSKERREAELSKCVARCESCHARKSGREAVWGERHGKALATTEQVVEIRRRVAAGERQASVARDLGYSRAYIWEIVHLRSRRFE